MNRIFGTASTDPAAGDVERCAVVRDGAVIGEATDGDVRLALLGHLTPLADPDDAARRLLGRYHERGESFLDGVAGHFATVVVDGDRLLLARDPSGQRRLFVHSDGDALRFSTRLADFAELLGPALALDRSREDFLLGYEFLPDDRTMYAGVRGLPAGTLLIWESGETREREIEPPELWTDLPTAERLAELPGETREEPVIDLLGRAFDRAVAELAGPDDTVGVLLGGFDSALVAAALVALGKRVESFSFRYEDASYNQAHVEQLAAHLGTRHNWVPITPAVIRDGLAHFAARFNQPVSQPHYVIASAAAIRAARERGVRHVLSGDGCDGLFLGYPTVHQRAVLIQTLSKMAPGMLTRLAPLARSPLLERRLGQPYRLARNVLRILGRPMPARGHIASCTLDDVALAQLRVGPPPPQAEGVEQTLARLAEGLEGVSPVRLAYRGKSAVGLNRVKLEGSSAHAGVTIHSPFLHPGMARLARALPEQMSRPDQKTRAESTGKYALMQMAETRGLLPPEIIYQPKRSPVTAPVDRWYSGELRSFLLEQLEHLPFEVDGRYARSLVSHKLSEEAFRRFVGISRYAFNAISLLVTYASFCRYAP